MIDRAYVFGVAGKLGALPGRRARPAGAEEESNDEFHPALPGGSYSMEALPAAPEPKYAYWTGNARVWQTRAGNIVTGKEPPRWFARWQV